MSRIIQEIIEGKNSEVRRGKVEIFRFIGRIIDAIFAVVGALVASQAPLYMQYYAQQLTGHVAELQLQLEAMRKVAGHSGKSLDQYVQKFLTNGDSDFRMQGELMQGIVDRAEALSSSLTALQGAGVWERPFVFFKNIHWDIAQTTLKTFVPGLTLSLEGAVYAFVGILIGVFLFYLVKKVLSLIIAPFRALFSFRKKNPEVLNK